MHRKTIAGFLRPDGTLPRLAGGDPQLDTDVQRKLAGVEDDLTQLRSALKEKERAREEAKAAFVATEGYDTDSPEFKAAEEAAKGVSEVKEQILKAKNAQIGMLRMLGPNEAIEHASDDQRLKAERNGTPADGWDARGIIDGDTYKRLSEMPEIRVEKARVGSHMLGQVASRDAFKAALTSADVGGLIQPDNRGLVQLPLRPLQLLDLLPVGATTSNSIEYVQEVAVASLIAETAEGTLKPEEPFDWQDATAAIRTIAGWVKLNKQLLADAPLLQSFIDGRLRYKVRRRLENQVANGDGAGQNIRGLLNTTGILTPTVVAAETHLDRMHHGIVAVQLADYEPSFMGIHPSDWEDIRLEREEAAGAGTATGGYLMGAPAVAGGQTLWGLPVVVSQAFPEGTGLVGDANAALVLIREGVNVLISDSDQDDFIRNRVTMLGETRAGVMVWAPAAFAKVNLGAVV